jgi:hypothetical protein
MKQYVSKFSGKELDERLTRVDDIPTKTSELNNDSGFISEAEADNKYTDKNKTDVLERDIKDLKDRIDAEIPTKISQLENDKNYITNLDIQNKADLENGKIIASQLPDYILGQVMFGGLLYNANPSITGFASINPSSDFHQKYGNVRVITTGDYLKYKGVYFIVANSIGNTFLGIEDVRTGDWIISTGEGWAKIDNTDAVTSVAGLVGNVNASALAEALSDITDSNSLARKTDLPKKLSDLEIDVSVGSYPDWKVNDFNSQHYIHNRTHYIIESSASKAYSLDSKEEGDIIVTGLIPGSYYNIYNYDGSSSSTFIFIKGAELTLPVGPPVKVVCEIVENDGCLKLITSTYHYNYDIHINSLNAKQLEDVFIPDNIVRKAELPKKLSELENDIEIGGGGSYDDSEIKEILSNIVDEEGYLYSNGEKVDMRFTRSLLPVGTSVPANANLNTIEFLKIGKYYCSQNVDAKTVKNCPVNMAFSMEVFNPLGVNVDDETTAEYTYRLRVLTPYDTGIHYTQCCRTSGTPGTWTYDSWYVTPRSKFALASSKNDGSAAIGATNKGVYIDSNGEIKAMSYTIAKNVPSNAVFTDTDTKVTSVGNHYTPAEDEDQQIDAPEGEVVTGIKRDAAGHVVGVVSTIQEAGETEYESAIADKTLTTPNAVGGIAKGTKVSDLEGKTFAEMFDDLLFPTVNPEFTKPSASIAFKNYSSPQEVGATGPTSANFTTGYNAGEIKLNGVKQANRGGTLDSTNSFIYVNGSSSNKTLPAKVTLGKTTFNYRAAYNQGPQPKNNKGGNYDSPLAAGTADSSAITLNGTYPWYASTSAATSTNPVVKQSLVAWNTTAGNMSTGQFTVQPSGTLPQVFKLPRKLHTLQLKNALNGQMETVTDVSKDYTESTETINIGGTNVTYYVYTYSGSTRGSVTLLAKF